MYSLEVNSEGRELEGSRRSRNTSIGEIAAESVETLRLPRWNPTELKNFDQATGVGDAAKVKEIGECGNCRSRKLGMIKGRNPEFGIGK